jgi:hypothetical protein
VLSFRYHLVSIVAVFLALALGVLVGTTVVNQSVIDDLERRTNAAVDNADQLRGQVAALQEEVETWSAFGVEIEPLMVGNVLAGRTVVIVTLEGVDVAQVDGIRRVLQQSGATVAGILVGTGRLAAGSESLRTDLADAIGSSGSRSAEELTDETGARLGARLALGVGASDSDLLERLLARQFLVLRSATLPVGEIGGNGQAVVLVAGGEVEPPVSPEAFLTPAARSLTNLVRPVVVAETVDTVYPFVPLIRGDQLMDGHLVTVDNADTVPGRVALALALRDLYRAPGEGADYGVKDGATRLLPPP